MVGMRQQRIRGKNVGGDDPCPCNCVAVTRQARQLEIVQACLARAKELALAANLKILVGESESVNGLEEGI
jgi:hypothetical protein